MTILGMDLYSKPRSDDEFIEAVRLSRRRRKRFLGIHIAWALILLGGFLYVNHLIFHMDDGLLGVAERVSSATRVGLVVGIFMGLLLTLAAVNLALAVGYARRQRTASLLIKCYDALKGERSREPAPGKDA